MPTNYNYDGLLEAALGDTRLAINDHVIDGRYSDSDLLRILASSFNIALTDLNTAMSKNPIYVEHTINFNTTDKEYLLPTGVNGIAQLAIPDPATGRVESLIPAFHLNELAGPNWSIVLPFLRLQMPFNRAAVGRVTFEPKAETMMHVGKLTGSTHTIAAAATTFALSESAVQYGRFDKRPNAYIGGMLRVYKAKIPSGYLAFPVQERIVTAFSAATLTLTLNKCFDVEISDASANEIWYEIVPLVDPGIMRLAGLEAARFLCETSTEKDKARSLSDSYERQKIAVRRNYQSLNQVREKAPPHPLNRIGGPIRMAGRSLT